VTWKEFLLLLLSWTLDQRPPVLVDWIRQHAADRRIATEDVENDLFESIVNKRQMCLVAAESSSVPELESNTEQARLLLQMAEQYLFGLDKLGDAEFRSLYGRVTYPEFRS